MTHAELHRATRMLDQLTSQAAALFLPGETAPVCLASPLELVIVYDDDQSSAQKVQSVLGDVIRASDSHHLRLLPVRDANYCRMKNAGAAFSKGDIIIFLDSDVIPGANWLGALLGSFADPQVCVVVGNTYVDHDGPGAYSKAMALSWMFPLLDPSDRLAPSTWFYANNVAFRREIFLSRQFPDVPGLIHAPAALLINRLQRDGVLIWFAGNARASHPPPNGPRHFVMRAMSGGRARAFSGPHLSISALIRWIRQDIGSASWGCKQIVLHASKVGLRWWQIPLAMTFPAAYFALFCLGSLLSAAFPGLMRDRFQL